MSGFIVSARKYRPQHFNTVVGQSHITNTLKNAIIHKQLAQAYLFCGPRGVGKTTCARIFGKTINCFNVTKEGECCDQCESCRSFNEGASLNIYELDGASNNSVDDIRALVDQVRVAPQLGDYRVYIIDEVHMLSPSAFNAFLKTLEEPPKHAKFILATTEKHKIIPTVLSRCQVFNFNRIQVNDISAHLAFMAKSEGVTVEPEALRVIAQKADGGLRDACSIFDQMVAFTGNTITYKHVVENLNVLDYDHYFAVTDFFLNLDLSKALLLFDDILKKGFDAHHFLTGLGEHLRNLLVCQDPQTVTLLEVSEGLNQKYLTQAKNCAPNFILKSLAIITKADVSYRSARNQRLLVEMVLIQMSFLNKPAESEKKNTSVVEEPEIPPFKKEEPLKAETKNQGKHIEAPAEPEIRFAEKPRASQDTAKIKSSFSLSESLKPNAVASPVPTPEKKEAGPIAIGLTNKTITQAEVDNYLKLFTDDKLKAGSKQIAAIFKTAKTKLVNNALVLILQNETHLEQLNEIKMVLTDNIRAHFSNYLITLDIIIEEHKQETKAYRPIDIFKAMSEKNPALLELKKKFDLEIDY